MKCKSDSDQRILIFLLTVFRLHSPIERLLFSSYIFYPSFFWITWCWEHWILQFETLIILGASRPFCRGEVLLENKLEGRILTRCGEPGATGTLMLPCEFSVGRQIIFIQWTESQFYHPPQIFTLCSQLPEQFRCEEGGQDCNLNYTKGLAGCKKKAMTSGWDFIKMSRYWQLWVQMFLREETFHVQI